MATISDGMTTLAHVQIGDWVLWGDGPSYRASMLCTGLETWNEDLNDSRWHFGSLTRADPAMEVRIVGHLGPQL